MDKKVAKVVDALLAWWKSRESPERIRYEKLLSRHMVDINENGDIDIIVGRWLRIRRRSDGKFNELDLRNEIKGLDELIAHAQFLRKILLTLGEQQAKWETQK